jgi:hypothetical protein
VEIGIDIAKLRFSTQCPSEGTTQSKSLITTLSSKLFFLLVITLCARQLIGQQLRKSIIRPIPVYPAVAKRLNLEDRVRIDAVVGLDG